MLKQFALTAAIALGFTVQAQTGHAETLRQITVAGGCFWCVESDFESVRGVKEAVSGYTGGTVANPSYRQVGSKTTGHYEAVQITYDADQVSRAQLYNLFFRSIDPLDAGGQFCDRGSPYKTAIFVSNADRADAEAAKAQAGATLGASIATQILPAAPFYPAEDYHQNYYKSSVRVGVTSVGVGITRAQAYKRYREGCGRDARVQQIWGDAAPFAKGH